MKITAVKTRNSSEERYLNIVTFNLPILYAGKKLSLKTKVLFKIIKICTLKTVYYGKLLPFILIRTIKILFSFDRVL